MALMDQKSHVDIYNSYTGADGSTDGDTADFSFRLTLKLLWDDDM